MTEAEKTYFEKCVEMATSAGMDEEEAVGMVLAMVDEMMGVEEGEDSEDAQDLPEGWLEKAQEEGLMEMCADVAEEIMNPSDDEEEGSGDSEE